MQEVFESILDFIGDVINSFLGWIVNFFATLLSGDSLPSVGNLIINAILYHDFDFSLSSLLNLLCGIGFIFLAVRLLIMIIGG